jgi:pimeloyl-ACP methyl ester carboxylesterase
MLATVAGLGGCFLERRALFPAPVITDGSNVTLDPNAHRLWFDTPLARTEAFFLPARTAVEGPIVIYTHSNGELIDDWADKFRLLRDSGVSVLLVEYPGYGRSSGAPSQPSITRTLVAAYDWAVAQPSVDPKRVVGYGRSLGGGVICALARERSLAAMILESTFTSVPDLAFDRGVPGFLFQSTFDCLSTVRSFAGPILFLHGERDNFIPLRHAWRMHSVALASEIQVLPCGHMDCPRSWPSITAFLLRHRLLQRSARTRILPIPTVPEQTSRAARED